MIILGIETSCDETAAAILEKKNGRIQILSNIVASSASLQAKYGGIIPEQAAREQIKSIIPVIQEALTQTFPDYTLYPIPYTLIDAIAVTQGPGLVGSLLVGVETAKVLARIWNKPLIPINHLIGHFYANWISTVIPAPDQVRGKLQQGIHTNKQSHGSRIKSGMTENTTPTFPCIGLLVSGGHTDLVLFQNHGKYTYLGGTRDDAAGECFDKCARLLGLPYPGGPEISKLAKSGKDTYKLPRPMITSDDFDFSFSGLKTAVANLIKTFTVIPSETRNLKIENKSRDLSLIARDDNKKINNLCASIEAAIIDVLVEKTILAAQKYSIEQIIVAGGVAANQKLVSQLTTTMNHELPTTNLSVPPPHLCTDNATMIASAAFFSKPTKNPINLQADPNLSLAY